MLLSIDTDDILYRLLTRGSTSIKNSINGDVYVQGERPDGSALEDVVVNNLFTDEDFPQSGMSNVNIHVPDIIVNIGGVEQYKCNREKIRELLTKVLVILRNANEEGISIAVDNETILQEEDIHQHYANIRVSWHIIN